MHIKILFYPLFLEIIKKLKETIIQILFFNVFSYDSHALFFEFSRRKCPNFQTIHNQQAIYHKFLPSKSHFAKFSPECLDKMKKHPLTESFLDVPFNKLPYLFHTPTIKEGSKSI